MNATPDAWDALAAEADLLALPIALGLLTAQHVEPTPLEPAV